MIVVEYFDVDESRSVPPSRRSQAKRLLGALADPDRGFDAVVVGEPHYAAQFYAAVANGQSIRFAHLSAQAALELAGHDLPTLAHSDDVDPATTVPVKPAQ